MIGAVTVFAEAFSLSAVRLAKVPQHSSHEGCECSLSAGLWQAACVDAALVAAATASPPACRQRRKALSLPGQPRHCTTL